jgi:hypothetical protein
MLKKDVFPRSPTTTDDQLVRDMVDGAPSLAWLNRLRADTLRKETRFLIDRLFRSELPDGWTEWGFKEILYGLNNSVPEILLELFPASPAAFTFRDPRETIESMIRTWTPELLKEPLDPSLETVYRARANRWRQITTYFLELKQKQPDRTILLSIESLEANFDAALAAMQLQPYRREPAAPPYMTNRGNSEISDTARRAMSALFETIKDELLPIYNRAQRISHEDVGS